MRSYYNLFSRFLLLIFLCKKLPIAIPIPNANKSVATMVANLRLSNMFFSATPTGLYYCVGEISLSYDRIAKIAEYDTGLYFTAYSRVTNFGH